jgi:hypothetical protein
MIDKKITCWELNDIALDVYGLDPVVEIACEMCINTEITIVADGKRFSQDMFTNWLMNQQYTTEEIFNLMNKLALDGFISEGIYKLVI